MTWAETSSLADVDLHPLAPPPSAEVSAPARELPAAATDLEAEIGSWMEAPVAMADEAGLAAMGERAQALGYLWVELGPPGPEYRGRLGLYIEESLENRLEQLGAPPAGIHASTSLDASLSDQLYRARFVERRGLALGIPNLEGIANLGRTLDADDSSVLRWWIAATADRPVRLVVSTQNQFLRVYPSPVLFDSLFEVAPEPVSPRAPSVALAESAQAMELSDLPPSVFEAPTIIPPAPEPEAPVEAGAGPASDEPTTDVLGTRVAPIQDIALPGLDRALGLLDEEEAVSPEVPALALDTRGPSYDEVLAIDEARRAVTLAPPPDESAPDESVLWAAAEEAMAIPAPAPLPTDVPAPKAERPLPALSGMPLGEVPGIDAAEFLRVLEEDSRRPPAAEPVQAAPSEAVVAPSLAEPAAVDADLDPLPVPTPLPQKKLRRPFLRLSEASEEEPVPSAAVPVEPEPAPKAALPSSALHAPAPPMSASRMPEAPAARAPEPEVTAEPTVELPVRAEAAPPARTPALDPNDPFNQLAQHEWRTWRDALSRAAGPRPLAAIERMFVTDYTRLAEAARRGIADETATSALAEWQASFQKSYAETFDALRVRGKRPTMVLDLPDVAQRLGRLQGARRVQLLLIDGLRFDLGLMVQERLRAKVDAALTERLLLWSALPSTTTYQLELLGKGPEGLLERFDVEDSPTLVARGRAARSPRRIRTGRVELQKIDVVEDALRTLGRPIAERFDEIAAETADAIAEHMAAQAPRTLVVVFGDHGFRLDPARAGTTEEVRQGGSTPEEVLVPAFAWLTGAVH